MNSNRFELFQYFHHSSKGITILPELAIQSLSEERKKESKKSHLLFQFEKSVNQQFCKKKLLQVLSDELKTAVTPFLSEMQGE